MTLATVLARLVLVVATLLICVSIVVLRRSNLAAVRQELGTRLRIGLPALTALGTVLVLNTLFRTTAAELSWFIGLNITGWIYRIEGEFVYTIQGLFGPAWTGYFSFMYVYGYALLIVFPLVAYFAMSRLDAFQELTIAYTANYAIGLVCYVIFIAYGPRNLIPELVGAPLYTEYPDYRLLTSQVNRHTNVFPSLHTSLSTTVALFAWRTREEYPRWLPIAAGLAGSIIIATMYLAIHWFIDVVAGIGLALFSTWVGVYVHDRGYLRAVGSRIETTVRALAGRS